MSTKLFHLSHIWVVTFVNALALVWFCLQVLPANAQTPHANNQLAISGEETGKSLSITPCSRARRLLKTKKLDAAISDYESRSKASSSDSQVHIDLAALYLERGKIRNCISECTKAIKLDPNSSQAYSLRADGYREIKEYQKAIADSTKAIQLDSSCADAYMIRAFCYPFRGLGNSDKAHADADKAIRLAPDSCRAYATKGVVCLNTLKGKLAAAYFKKALALNPDCIEVYLWRNTYKIAGADKQSIIDLNKALTINPYALEAYRLQARIRMKSRNENMAMDCARRMLRIDPGCAEAYSTLAEIELYKGSMDTLEATLQPVADALGGRQARKPSAEQLAASIQAAGQPAFERGLKNIQSAIQIDPTRADFYRIKATLEQNLQMSSKALEDANRAIDLDPELAEAYLVRSRIYKSLGQPHLADADQKKGLQLNFG